MYFMEFATFKPTYAISKRNYSDRIITIRSIASCADRLCPYNFHHTWQRVGHPPKPSVWRVHTESVFLLSTDVCGMGYPTRGDVPAHLILHATWGVSDVRP